ncbi:nucleotidyl transferase AbiEii/AbiGii toxin family protein [Streptomyces sp. NPDC058848]|uniref:nucleotidyl transferase AbiEii/AbiGii toxin family protein n=1 Tax=unclassified Streptomyces TaxID=2593676 RepID=UPI00368A0F6F
MKLPPLHERLLADILDLGSPYPLVLTGGYAVQAHGLVERFSRDLDVATENPAPMQEIVASLTAGLSARGWRTTHVQTDPLSGRFLVTDPDTGEECEVDVLKEAFWAPPAQTPYGPVLSLDDVIGTKVRALADRGTVASRFQPGAVNGGWRPCTADVQGSRAIPRSGLTAKPCCGNGQALHPAPTPMFSPGPTVELGNGQLEELLGRLPAGSIDRQC